MLANRQTDGELLVHLGAFSFDMLKTLFYSAMYEMSLTLCQTWSLLRAIAGKPAHIKIFFNYLHTVCFMYGLSIYEIKRLCHNTQFFIISQGNF